MTGVQALAYALGVTLLLLAAVYVLSRLLVRYGLLPLSGALSISGLNIPLLYVLILPGVVIHELSHYLACLITRVRVRDVRLFAPQDNGVVGYVVHDATDPFRRSLIALAPFLGGSLAIYVLVRFGLPAGEIDPLNVAPANLGQAFSADLAYVTSVLRSADLRHITTWVVFYLLFSLSFAVAPSNDDLAPLAVYGVAALVVVGVVALVDKYYTLGIARSPLLNNAADFLARLLTDLNVLLLLSVTVTTLGALVIIPIAVIAYWLRSTVARG